MEKLGRVELLAPAGSPESFYGAIHAGADAVYLAGSRFGARAYAENFTTEELVKCIRYGHLLGRKIYLTVNTLLKEHEMGELDGYLRPFYEEGLDAVIVQDPGVLRLVRESFPGLKIHASTQMTLCGSHGVSLLKAMGAVRVVPARELSLEEIRLLKERIPDMEVECFIHGAMCYCYSGQCLFSSILGGRSGNRGRCAQPCRLPYSVYAEGTKKLKGYPLSLKDMCTIEHIPRLVEAGIDSFKIEGRMKKPEYAAGVTESYRRHMDRYYELRERKGPKEAAESYYVEKGDWKRLRSLYIRSEIQDGYYFKRNGGDMVTMDSPAYSGSDEELLAEIREKYIASPLKLPVLVRADFQAGRPAEVTLRLAGEAGSDSVSCTVWGDVAGEARKRPITEEDVASRLGRLGDSAFYAQELQVSVGDGCFYPLGQINELRREAVAGLEEKLLAARGYEGVKAGACPEGQKERTAEAAADECPEMAENRESSGKAAEVKETGGQPDCGSCYAVSVRTLRQLEAVADWIAENQEYGIRRVYIDGDLMAQEWERTSSLCRRLRESSSIYVALPYILRAIDDSYLEEIYRRAGESGLIEGFLARSVDGLGFLMEKQQDKEDGGERKTACRADAGIYTWNLQAREELAPLPEGFCLPYELNAFEQRGLLEGGGSWEKIIYGRIPMMLTANCLQRTAGRCVKGKGTNVVLRDRYRKDFPVVVNCLHCMNIIYNSVPLSLYKELSKWKGRVDLRMDFTLESPEETKRLLDSFIKDAPFPEQEYTSGHEKRGVE